MIELIVVVGVMVVLAASLFPVLARARGHVLRVRCLSNLHQIGRGHLLYLQDWDEQFPDWAYPGPPRSRPFAAAIYWTEFLQPYLRSTEVLRDPAAVRGPDSKTTLTLSDYALLTWDRGCAPFDRNMPCIRWPGPPLSFANVPRPAATINLVDGRSTTWQTYGLPARHGGGSNVSFLDGHARWVTERELWQVDEAWDYRWWLRYGSAHR